MGVRQQVSIAVLTLVLAGSGAVPLLPTWFLDPIDPDPFCNAPGQTVIAFGIDQESEVLLEVMSPDSATVQRILVHGVLPVGTHTVVWDGRDEAGEVLPSGQYPYTLTARIIESPDFHFQETRVATIECPTSTVDASWGRIKKRFRK